MTRSRPYAHQQEALQWLGGPGRNAGLLELDYGLGKSRIAIEHAVAHNLHPTLIICRKDNFKTWADEINRWAPRANYVVIDGTRVRRLERVDRALASPWEFVIINYEGISVVRKRLVKADVYWPLVVVDESTAIANSRSKRARAINRLILPRSGTRLLLTGDACPQDDSQLFNQMYFATNGQLWGSSFAKWRDENFVYAFGTRTGWQPSDPTALRASMAPYLFYRRKRGCVDLPPLIRKTEYCELDPKQKSVYDELRKTYALEAATAGFEFTTKWATVVATKLRQVASGLFLDGKQPRRIGVNKMAALAQLLEGLRRHHRKICVFCCFNEEIRMAVDVCNDVGLTSAVYAAWTDRQRAAWLFETNDSCQVFIGQVDRMIGLNELAVADIAIFFSTPWRLEHRQQAESRLERPQRRGKPRESITIVDLVAPGTVDEIAVARADDRRWLRSVVRDREMLLELLEDN